jgi:hypothetical protein
MKGKRPLSLLLLGHASLPQKMALSVVLGPGSTLLRRPPHREMFLSMSWFAAGPPRCLVS